MIVPRMPRSARLRRLLLEPHVRRRCDRDELHGSVSSRGIFDRGAANVFVHSFDSTDPAWLDGIASVLAALRAELDT